MTLPIEKREEKKKLPQLIRCFVFLSNGSDNVSGTEDSSQVKKDRTSTYVHTSILHRMARKARVMAALRG